MAENITHVVVDGEGGILRTTHFSVLVALAKAICAWSIAKLRSLCKELGGVLIVDEYDVVDASLMEERELVKSMWEFGSCVLGGALEPFDTFLWSLGHAQFAIEFGNAEAIQRPGMGRRGSFAIKLDSLGRLATAAPAILTARTSPVGGIGVAMFSRKNEEGEGAIKVLAVLVRANAVGEAIGKEVLRRHVSTVSIALEEGGGLLYEIFAFFDSLFDVHDVGWCGLRDGKGLGGVDHEDGKFELEVRVLRLFSVGAVELKGSFVR
jgi:hypothetical protein